MAALVSLALAKDHLRIPQSTTERDVDLTVRISAASAIVADYLGTSADAAWDELTVPLVVQAAVLIVLAHYDEHRGDDMDKVDEVLWASLARLLMRSRDPAVA